MPPTTSFTLWKAWCILNTLPRKLVQTPSLLSLPRKHVKLQLSASLLFSNESNPYSLKIKKNSFLGASTFPLANHFQPIFRVLPPQTSEQLAALMFTVGLGHTGLGGAFLSLHPLAWLSSLVSNKIQSYCRYNIHCERCTLVFQKNMKELCAKAFSFLSSLPILAFRVYSKPYRQSLDRQ